MAEKLLNRAKIGAIGEQMRREGVTHRMRMQVPVDVGDANVFFDDAPDGTLRETSARIIEEDGFSVWPPPATRPLVLFQKLLTHRPIFFQCFLSLSAVRNDAFLAALAADSENAFFLLHVPTIEAGPFSHAHAARIT